MAAESDQSPSLTKDLERKLHEALSATPSIRAAVERGEPGFSTVDLSDRETADMLARVMWALIEHSIRVSEEVDRLRGIAHFEEEAKPKDVDSH